MTTRFGDAATTGYLDKNSFGGVVGRIGGLSIEELGTEYTQLLRRFAIREIKIARPGRASGIKIYIF